jgi:hypothetical protein
LILAAEDLGPSGTKVINLDIPKKISRLTIRFNATKTLTSDSAGPPGNIPRIEIVDGSTVLHSLTGYESQALGYYNRPPGTVFDIGLHINTLPTVDFFPIDFGRYLWDEQLAFDPTRFQNPQIKITWDENIGDTGTSVNACEVWADIFDEKEISPLGFLMAIEHYAYTQGADDSYEQFSLPEDRPIRQILLRAFLDAHEPYYNAHEVRFDEGTLDKIVFEETSLEYYFYRMMGTWPRIITDLQCDVAAADRTFYLPQSNYGATAYGTFHDITSAIFRDDGVWPMPGGKFVVIATAGSQFIGQASGYLPWSTFQFPMGKQDVIDDWYDPANKKPRMRIRAGTGGATVTSQIVLEELYKY